MKLVYLLLFVAFWYLPATGQSVGETNICFNGNCYNVFTITVDTIALKHISLLQNANGLTHREYCKTLNTGKNNMLINAAIDGDNCAPVGLRVSQGKVMNPLDLGTGSGNFYLKPNGVFMVTQTSAHIVESSKFSSYNNVVTAVQSGPMLIIDRNIHPDFNQNSPNSQIRSGVGIKQLNGTMQIVFAVSKGPVRFYDFAVFFREKLGADNALCLQSVKCSLTMPFQQNEALGEDHVNCSLLLFEH